MGGHKAPEWLQHDAVGFFLNDVKPSLKPEDLPEADELPEEEPVVEAKSIEHGLRSSLDHIPFRDSFSSYTHMSSDRGAAPNGLEEFDDAMQMLERNQPILKKIVRRHRGEWGFLGIRDWLGVV
ncbi:unnamed protein product [Durusdinium trenchii]|uniref:Uncharacterized protein n=1 Tax=Durusdinium trenchii TaxID=1381693 RepID=A0ABP0SRZ1_9DINO